MLGLWERAIHPNTEDLGRLHGWGVDLGQGWKDGWASVAETGCGRGGESWSVPGRGGECGQEEVALQQHADGQDLRVPSRRSPRGPHRAPWSLIWDVTEGSRRNADRPLSMRCQALCDKLCSQHLTPDSKPSWEGSIMTPTLQMKEPRSRKGKWFANREWSQTRYVGVTDGQAQSFNHCHTASQYKALENGNKKESVSSFLEVVCCNGWRKERDNIWSLSPRAYSATSCPCPLVQIPPIPSN